MAEAVNQGANAQQVRIVLSPGEGETVWLRKLGVRFMIGGEETQDNFALVEHPIGPRALAAPMHTHRYEDEYTYVLEGEVGVQVDLRGLGALVAEPERDHRSVDAGVQQPHRRRVAEHVQGDRLLAERRAAGVGDRHVSGEAAL